MVKLCSLSSCGGWQHSTDNGEAVPPCFATLLRNTKKPTKWTSQPGADFHGSLKVTSTRSEAQTGKEILVSVKGDWISTDYKSNWRKDFFCECLKCDSGAVHDCTGPMFILLFFSRITTSIQLSSIIYEVGGHRYYICH